MLIEKINQNRRIIVVTFFVLMTLIGLLITPDYGMPWDEELEIRTLGSNVREYISLFKGKTGEPFQSSTGIPFPDYLQNPDMDHGQSAYYPLTPALFADYGANGPRTMMLIWHGYTFLIFMAGVLGLYFVCKFLMGDWKYGLLGSLFLYLSPRFFAEGHYNSKDMVVMALVILLIAAGIKLIESRRISSALVFAFVAAIATNMRISALFMFGLLGLLYIVNLTVKKQWNAKNLWVGLTTVLAFFLISYLITPAAWREPLGYIAYVIGRSSNFADWPGAVYFQGLVRRPVPSSYIPTMIAVTTPILILALTLLGHITTIAELIRGAIKKNSPAETQYLLICIIFIWTFLLFAIIRRPILYNSWRHLYFLYGPMLILAVAAVRFLVQRAKGKLKMLVVSAVVLQLLVCALLIGISHPFQYVYFNPLAGKDPAQKYEFDYWNVSQTQMLMKLADQIDGDEVNVCATDWYTADGLAKAGKVLPEAYKDRVRIFSCNVLGMKTDADYLVVNRLVLQVMEAQQRQQTPTWLYTQGNLLGLLPKYPPVASLRAFGSDFMTVYSLNKK
ncbi:MAG: hypothetical protein GX768_11610 [Chloroflexi bacterium]|nr:hypothetical protein [Chloroflexota bacterium]